MAKQKKQKRQDPQASASGAESATDGQMTAASLPASPAASQAEETLDLHDAARRWIPGFKEHWWPGLSRHAQTMGFAGQGTPEQCKTVLRHWGAKID